MKDIYKIAGISKQAYHKYQKLKTLQKSEVPNLIKQVGRYRKTHPGCGLAKLYSEIKPTTMGRDRFIYEMQQVGLGVRKKRNRKRTTYAGKLSYPNYIGGLLLWTNNQVWQSDITYYQVGNRYYYIIFIIDVYTKEIQGYGINDHMRAVANLAALNMAIAKTDGELRMLIHHSDRGTQYTSNEYIERLQEIGAIISMCQSPQENAYAERINGTIKNEYLNYWDIHSFKALTKSVKKAVSHYNTQRRHGYLPYSNTPQSFRESLSMIKWEDRHHEVIYSSKNPKTKRPKKNQYHLLPNQPAYPICPIFKDMNN